MRLLLPEEKHELPLALFEGDPRALEFLGKLFLAQATFADDGFQISPRGPGERLFKRRSQLGLYIQRVGLRPR